MALRFGSNYMLYNRKISCIINSLPIRHHESSHFSILITNRNISFLVMRNIDIRTPNFTSQQHDCRRLAVIDLMKCYSFVFIYRTTTRVDNDFAVATSIDGPAVCDNRLTWAGAGGQYSMLAGPCD